MLATRVKKNAGIDRKDLSLITWLWVFQKELLWGIYNSVIEGK